MKKRSITLYQFDMSAENFETELYSDYMKIKIGASISNDLDISRELFNKLYNCTKIFNEKLINMYQGVEHDIELTDLEILNTSFEMFNIGPDMFRKGLLYSMSTGDILQIDDKYYICMGTGWNEITI